ncbi:MAG: phosphoglucosamine mutase [Acidobacteriota bacterium]|nr:phosphoglucosamine mutase [Acidobacteriota bacterium]
MAKLFGTDGMRGEAGRFPLDAATVRVVGRSLSRHLSEGIGGRAPRIVVGRVISASHNPYQDNGIKIFSPSGRKLDDATERLIEADIEAEKGNNSTGVGIEQDDAREDEADALRADVLRERYLNYLAEEVADKLGLEGLKIVLDCANGAAYGLAPMLFERLGASVIAINNTPDGRNINRDCGSLHIEGLREKVMSEAADLGVAFDGDADRSLFVDARGRFVDGDATLWVMAKYLQERGRLEGGLVVATVMSNIGLEIALRSKGLRLLRADVGDKYVLEELLRTHAALGGEQSGHIIFPRLSLAGDGMITTVCLLRAMREARASLDELTAGFTRYPQVLVNVRVREKPPFSEVEEIERAARETEERLGDSGRLLLRYSGTEPLARIMIEGERQDLIEEYANSLARVIREAIGER